MQNSMYTLPAADELEISIFGPGYGEAIALHIGNGKWILVDSCLNPDSKQSAVLEYLRNLGVDVSVAVKLVIATHWHDDHIRGLSTVCRECKSAQIVISNALRVEEFRKLAASYASQNLMRSSGVDESVEILRLLSDRVEQGKRVHVLAIADRLIYRDFCEQANAKWEVKIYTLSPSDMAVQQAQATFNELLPREEEGRKRVVSLTPNHTSVVLWAEAGTHKILLGADLEETSDSRTGWSVILSDSTIVDGKAEVFKIPHHGSENAHHQGVWTELLTPQPLAALTPFCRGKKFLPAADDIARICHHTLQAFATAPPRQLRQRWSSRVVRDFVAQQTRDIHAANYGWGQIRFRRRIDDKSSDWSKELYGDAYLLRS